ncbi:Chaperonin 60 subunit beta 2, chloroplastic [Gossypium australe]|uniref:Chaperonin 60 subunit beta 2, chloroplastic n=1 Tax=Gossypium australe TaxID=47621 RepID=A0A5B6V0B6_9ROSI|nr:Chaperonin 60 subunit beta 2, chloroplastic [Gossypium australe]
MYINELQEYSVERKPRGNSGKGFVVRCCLEHAASVAKTFLMFDCVVVEIKELEPVPAENPWIIQDTATKADVEGKPNKVSNLHRSNDKPV